MLFVPFRRRLSLCLLPPLLLRSRTLTPICQIRGDELDGASTHELVHHIHGKATPDERVHGSFTRCKPKQLPIWDLWLASEYAHQEQNICFVPYPLPPSAYVLRFHWIYISRPCGTRKARICYDGSKRAALELPFAQTCAYCIDQQCMPFFFALSAAMSFVVIGVVDWLFLKVCCTRVALFSDD